MLNLDPQLVNDIGTHMLQAGFVNPQLRHMGNLVMITVTDPVTGLELTAGLNYFVLPTACPSPSYHNSKTLALEALTDPTLIYRHNAYKERLAVLMGDVVVTFRAIIQNETKPNGGNDAND